MNTAKRNSPDFFELAHCSECDTTHDLQVHRYTEEIKCTHCINDLLAQVAKEEEGFVGRNYDEDKGDSERLEYLIQERSL